MGIITSKNYLGNETSNKRIISYRKIIEFLLEHFETQQDKLSMLVLIWYRRDWISYRILVRVPQFSKSFYRNMTNHSHMLLKKYKIKMLAIFQLYKLLYLGGSIKLRLWDFRSLTMKSKFRSNTGWFIQRAYVTLNFITIFCMSYCCICSVKLRNKNALFH